MEFLRTARSVQGTMARGCPPMSLDAEKCKLILDKLSDEVEEAARTATKPLALRDSMKVVRDGRQVTVSRFFRVEFSVSGEKERVEAVLVTAEDQRPESRDYPIPGDNSQYRALAKELIQPLIG